MRVRVESGQRRAPRWLLTAALGLLPGCMGFGSSGTAADGGPGDAGSGGGTVADAGGGDGGAVDFYGAVRCPTAGFTVCDDFEAASVDTGVWTVEHQNGTTEIDSTRAARGQRSLHARIQGASGKALLSLKSKVQLGGSRLWGRAFMYVPLSAKDSLKDHSNFVSTYGTNGTGSGAVYAAAIGNGKFFGLFYQVSPTIDESSLVLHPGQTTDVPLDRWFCIEWEFDGVDRRLRLYLDDALIPSSVIEGRDPPGLSEFRIGPEFTFSEVWIDSVALSSERIQCRR